MAEYWVKRQSEILSKRKRGLVMKANMKRTKDVIVSMEPSKHRKVYHRPGCIYVERIKPQNKMIISKKQAQKYRYQSCKYCNGLVGEVRTNELLPVWEEEHHIKIDYIKRTDTLYVRTEIGCWKIFFHDETEKYLLYHRNNYSPELSLEQRQCNKVVLDKELANTILTRTYNFIIHEKSLLEYRFMGEKDECENKFLVIEEIVALIYCEAIRNQLNIDYPLIEKIKKELSACKISTVVIDMLERIESNELEECFDIFENIILTKNKKLYSSVFTGIQCMVFIKENCDQGTSFEKFFSSIKYLDIEYSKTVWIHLAPLIRQPFFAKEETQRYIALSISKCIDIYEELANQGERYYLDGLYNCVDALRQYCESIKSTGSSEIDELKKCIEKAMHIKNYEITNIWCR